MKKILLSAMVLSLTGLTAFTQQPLTQIAPVQIRGNGHGNSVQNVVDTLADYLNRDFFYSRIIFPFCKTELSEINCQK